MLEGDNQKQADFLSRSPVKADAKKLHDIEVIAWSFQIRAAEDFVKSIQTSQKLNCEVQEILSPASATLLRRSVRRPRRPCRNEREDGSVPRSLRSKR